jgi:glycosyltransferase involved in cell wall biosynthesis
MKIVHVITRMIVGGAQENTLLTADGLATIGGHVVIVATGPETGSEGDLLETYRGPVRIITVPHLVRSIRPWDDVLALVELIRLLRTERPDVVHTHSSKAGVLGRIAARVTRTPLIVHTLHSLVFHPYQPRPIRTSLRLVKQALVPFTDRYVSVSDNIRERAIAAGIGRPEKHSTIYSGFRTEDFTAGLVSTDEARRRLGVPDGRFVIGVVARLFDLKGHADVIASLEKLVVDVPDAVAAFVGSGPLEAALRADVRARGLEDHVVFVGRVPPTEIPVAFGAFDVLAHASLREGLARVIPQAVLARVPVVCYDLDGSGEIVADGVNGYLVPAGDVDALADRLRRLAVDEELRRALGGAGSDWIASEFAVSTMAARHDELYRHASQGRGSRRGVKPGAAWVTGRVDRYRRGPI